MGSKISKNGNSHNDFDGKKRHGFKSTAFSFLDTSKIQSFNEPTLMKLSRPFPTVEMQNGPKSSLAFRHMDEKLLLFGAIWWLWRGTNLVDLQSRMYDMPRRPFTLRILDGKFGLINLHSGKIQQTPMKNHSLLDISISPNADHVVFLTYTGDTYLSLWTFNNASNLIKTDETHIKSMESRTHGTCCSFAPNAKWIVMAVCSNLFTASDKNHLEVYTISKDIVGQKKLCKKEEVSIGRDNVPEEFTSLEFSSDSLFLAVGSFARSGARVFLVSTQNWECVSEIMDNSISNYSSIWPAFNPLSAHLELITSTEDGSLTKWDTTSLYSDKDGQLDLLCKTQCSDTSSIPITSSPIFSPDGSMFAIPLLDGSVIILDPTTFQKLWIVPCPDFQVELKLSERSNAPQILSATSVCFSKSCKYIGVAYSGHVVGVWLLPRVHFSLKHLCRTKIISLYPPDLVHKLPIPGELKKYLFYQL